MHVLVFLFLIFGVFVSSKINANFLVLLYKAVVRFLSIPNCETLWFFKSSKNELNIFDWNFAHVSHLLMSTKGCLEFFLFCLDPEWFAKTKFFTFLWITQDLNKIKKSQTIFCRYF